MTMYQPGFQGLGNCLVGFCLDEGFTGFWYGAEVRFYLLWNIHICLKACWLIGVQVWVGRNVSAKDKHWWWKSEPIFQYIWGMDCPSESCVGRTRRVSVHDLCHHKVNIVVRLLIKAVLIWRMSCSHCNFDAVLFTQGLHFWVNKLCPSIKVHTWRSAKDSNPVCEKGFNDCRCRLVGNEDSTSVACECINNVQDVRSRFIGKLGIVLYRLCKQTSAVFFRS